MYIDCPGLPSLVRITINDVSGSLRGTSITNENVKLSKKVRIKILDCKYIQAEFKR